MDEILVVKGFDVEISANISSQIKDFELQVKAIKEKEDELKEKILVAMREHGVTKIESPDLTISYIAPTTKDTLDTKKLKEERPDVYNEYVRVSEVKDSIRIRVK